MRSGARDPPECGDLIAVPTLPRDIARESDCLGACEPTTDAVSSVDDDCDR
jgi:hypothetical protein